MSRRDDDEVYFEQMMARDLDDLEPFDLNVDWPRRRIPTHISELECASDVDAYRESNRIPEDETCPRWVECSCMLSKLERGECAARCGGVEKVRGLATYCKSCGGLL